MHLVLFIYTNLWQWITLTFLFCVATNVLHTEPYRFFFFFFLILSDKEEKKKEKELEHVNLFAFSLKIYNPHVVCVL